MRPHPPRLNISPQQFPSPDRAASLEPPSTRADRRPGRDAGAVFEYNKDPYAGIYAILRRDLTTGETETVTGGPGGAVAPRLSPNGRFLSFVRA